MAPVIVKGPNGLLLQKGVSPSEAGVPPPKYSLTVDGDLQVERDVAVTLRDGVKMYIDLIRPRDAVNVPVVLSWGPYGKHQDAGKEYSMIPDDNGEFGCGVDLAWLNPYTGFESADGLRWCKAGYACITVNPRGMWWSEGDFASCWGEREARDVCDVIEWAGTQPWSSGKVGMTGVSYLAIIQWWAASLQPKHLAAIQPCEGLTDPYRELIFHGGIPESEFVEEWQYERLKYSISKVEAMREMGMEHPLDDEYWASKRPDLSKIEVPTYVIASWADQGLHTRGTLRGFEEISSKHKHLEVHGRKKWAWYHNPATFERLRAFFDQYVKGTGNETDSWPLVNWELRTGLNAGLDKTSTAWPLPGRKLVSLHLDTTDGTLRTETPSSQGSARYLSTQEGESVVFEHVFGSQTDIVGSMGVKLHITIEEGEEADIFVALRKTDAQGNLITFHFQNALSKGPVALGWLRASHRALDPARSTPDRPWHPHMKSEPLTPGVAVAVEVEVWPSATRFEAGERLQLVIRGSDIYTNNTRRVHQTNNKGWHSISTGPEHGSQLTFNVLEST